MRKEFTENLLIGVIIGLVYLAIFFSWIRSFESAFSRRNYSYRLSLLRRFLVTTNKLQLSQNASWQEVESAVERWDDQ